MWMDVVYVGCMRGLKSVVLLSCVWQCESMHEVLIMTFLQVDEVLSASYSATKNERTEQIRERLVEMQSENFRQAVIQTILYGVFLFYAFLWNKHDYFHPISWIAIALLGKKMAFTTIKRKATSSRDGSKRTQEGTGSFDDSHTIKNALGGSSMIVMDSKDDDGFA